HALIRDNIEVYDIGSNVPSRVIPMQNTRDRDAEDQLAAERPERLWYSFGITNPGSLALPNYPTLLRNPPMPLVRNIALDLTDVPAPPAHAGGRQHRPGDHRRAA